MTPQCRTPLAKKKKIRHANLGNDAPPLKFLYQQSPHSFVAGRGTKPLARRNPTLLLSATHTHTHKTHARPSAHSQRSAAVDGGGGDGSGHVAGSAPISGNHKQLCARMTAGGIKNVLIIMGETRRGCEGGATGLCLRGPCAQLPSHTHPPPSSCPPPNTKPRQHPDDTNTHSHGGRGGAFHPAPRPEA